MSILELDFNFDITYIVILFIFCKSLPLLHDDFEMRVQGGGGITSSQTYIPSNYGRGCFEIISLNYEIVAQISSPIIMSFILPKVNLFSTEGLMSNEIRDVSLSTGFIFQASNSDTSLSTKITGAHFL